MVGVVWIFLFEFQVLLARLSISMILPWPRMWFTLGCTFLGVSTAFVQRSFGSSELAELAGYQHVLVNIRISRSTAGNSESEAARSGFAVHVLFLTFLTFAPSPITCDILWLLGVRFSPFASRTGFGRLYTVRIHSSTHVYKGCRMSADVILSTEHSSEGKLSGGPPDLSGSSMDEFFQCDEIDSVVHKS